MTPRKLEKMYCVKCRKSIMVENCDEIVFKSDRPALKGKCPICNTATYKIIAKRD